MDRAVDAKERLEALHQPVPRPTKAMLEQNKKEVASRHETGMMAGMLGNFEKHPDVAKASRVGDPTLVDPAPTNPNDVVRKVASAAGLGGDGKLGVQTIDGKVAPNQEAPRSDAPPAADDACGNDSGAAGGGSRSGGSGSRVEAECGGSERTEAERGCRIRMRCLRCSRATNWTAGIGTPSACGFAVSVVEGRGDGGYFFEQEEKEEGFGEAEPVLRIARC